VAVWRCIDVESWRDKDRRGLKQLAQQHIEGAALRLILAGERLRKEDGMRAVRLHGQGIDTLVVEEVDTPRPTSGEALVEVRAAAITRNELEWPQDRLPATPSYELAGVVDGEPVYAVTPFDRDGVAAEFAAVPEELLVRKPQTLDDVESAAVPLPALSAWQGLFDHGALADGQRVLITGAAGGVGHFATQLARWRGAHVIGTATTARADALRRLGADEVVDRARFPEGLAPVDLVFDTVGGELLERSAALVREGGRLVSVAEEPPAESPVDGRYFVVESKPEQLAEITGLIDGGDVCPAIDSVFALDDARAAFERSMAPGKAGKVVIRVTGP
jgi:NADPH:quinone reductase-like Zn-dependent oxidoreductase